MVLIQPVMGQPVTCHCASMRATCPSFAVSGLLCRWRRLLQRLLKQLLPKSPTLQEFPASVTIWVAWYPEFGRALYLSYSSGAPRMGLLYRGIIALAAWGGGRAPRGVLWTSRYISCSVIRSTATGLALSSWRTR